MRDAPLLTFMPLTDLLYTAPVPASMSLSPSTHRSSTFAPSTASDTSFFSTLFTMSAAVCQCKCSRYRPARPPNAGDEKSKRPRAPLRTLYFVKSAAAVDSSGFGASVFAGSDIVDRTRVFRAGEEKRRRSWRTACAALRRVFLRLRSI